jgi:integrase/recombinase XerD
MFSISDFIAAKRVGGPYAGNAGTEKTLSSYLHALRRAERLLGKPLSTMTQADAAPLMRAMEPLAASTKNQTLAALRACFRWAIGNGLYDGPEPFGGISHQRGPQRLPTILSDEAVARFFAAIDEPLYRLLFRTMYYGALRIGEARTLHSTQIREHGLLIDGKGGKERFVPLPAPLLAELRAASPPLGYVFRAEGHTTPLSTFPVYQAFDKARRKAGLDHQFVPHNLRATCATKFHAKTHDLAATQVLLGHANPQTTMRYVKIYDDLLQERYASVFN